MPTTFYGVYCGKDMKSYICELQGSGPVPVYRMTLGGPLADRTLRASEFWGSALIMTCGQVEIAVTGGTGRRAVAKAGDIVLFIDTRGEGHALAAVGAEPVQHLTVRFKEPWTALARSYAWPDNVLPPDEVSPAVNY